ncbi:cytochrome P450 [Sphaerulina musiva SO2202]|uniref:Cytochrome P450 n=1 Tax=Sphaerulina musiva (strain SO2202) TaxID=692275 RepID=N1QNI3_SPHMS|nr:cytochrome P450 [Sphaerulina musiva SO2202]EMF17783.1 cytochrome P450 [Sphaerulina musiva SO2202]
MALLPRVTALAAALTFLITRYTTYSLTPFATFPLLFSILFLLYQLYSILVWPHYISTLRHLPQAPNAHWFWGQTKRVLAEPSGRPMRDWVQNVPNQGLITYSVWFQQRVLITTPAALGEVLVTKNYDFVKPWHFRNGLGRILGIGVLLAEGEEHKIQRKNLAPAFAFGHLKRNIVPIFWSKAQELVDCLANVSTAAVDKKHVSDTDNTNLENAAAEHVHGAVDVGNWTSRATLDIIGLSGMGQDFNALQDPDNKLHQTYKLIFNPGKAGRMLQVLAIFLPSWLTRNLPIKRNQELNAASAYIKQVCRDLIAKKRTVLAEKGVEDVDILSVALGSGGFQDHELVNQMMTFLIAGHETTATAMIWSLYLLCKHKSIQTTLRAEIRSRIPSLSSPITAAQIDSCDYLQAFCTEVLRLWPPVSLTLRVADRDTSIQGQFIPRGTTIILAPAAINTCTHLWGKDALEFRPERWLKSNKSQSGNGGEEGKRGGADSNYSFLTFLHGPRSCIGQKFSQYELACLLAAWVGRYDTSFEKGSPLAHGEPEIKGGITAKPKGGLWTTLEEVPGW